MFCWLVSYVVGVCYDLIYKGVMVALMKLCKNVNEMKEWKKSGYVYIKV